MKKRVLIAHRSQFGYHIDTYKYSRLLQGEYAISYICWDHGNRRIPEEQTTVVYVPRDGNKIQRMARYLLETVKEIRRGDYDLILVVWFPFCSVLRFLNPTRAMILEITSAYVRDSKVMKVVSDTLLYFESLLFRHVLVLSESLRKELRINEKKAYIVPVGADDLGVPDKSFHAMRLLYIGTLEHRNIEKTVEGFARFRDHIQQAIDVSYDIVGFGKAADERKLAETIRQTQSGDRITFHGRIPHDELRPFLERSNIGVAFIPMVPHFDCQPSTKIFEYLLAGMAVLATATKENRLVINADNGVLVQDDADGVFHGLMELYVNRGNFTSGMIKQTGSRYTWHNIVCNGLKTHLDAVMNGR